MTNRYRFLIIGASGFIGRHLLRFFAQQADTEVMGTRLRSHGDHLVPFDLASDAIGDCIPSTWREPGENKWAFLCAAVVPMDRCATERAYARSVMFDGSKRCIDNLVDMGFTPVFLSTSYVFDGVEGGYREDDPPTPISHYGSLKRELEVYLRETHPRALVARLDKTVGTDPHESHLFSDWHQRASQQQPIVCIQDQVLGPTLVDDVAAILFQACRKGLDGCYHVANPKPVRRDELAGQFLEACGLSTEIQRVPLASLSLPEPRPLRSWLVADKVCAELGVAFTPVSEMLERYCAKIRG